MRRHSLGRGGLLVGGIKVGVRTKGWEHGQRDGGRDETEEE